MSEGMYAAHDVRAMVLAVLEMLDPATLNNLADIATKNGRPDLATRFGSIVDRKLTEMQS